MKRKLTENLYVHEFATSNGELNIDIAYLLALQAFRSWLGVPLYFGKGCGCRANASNSAHDIYMTSGKYSPAKQLITIPATGSDPHAKDTDSWGLMEKVEKWIDDMNDGLVIWESISDDILSLIDNPIFTGRGVYNNSNSGFVHLDMGHRSLNPAIRAKRKGVVRWVRVKGMYHYARDGEGFSDMRGRLGL